MKMKETTEVTTTTEHQVPQLYSDDSRRVVRLGVELGYQLGRDGDYRLLTAAMDSESVTLFEAVSGTDRYPPGRNMHVCLSAEEFDQLVRARQ